MPRFPVALHLYEIPITSVPNPSRKFIPEVAPHCGVKVQRMFFANLRHLNAAPRGVLMVTAAPLSRKEQTMLDLILVAGAFAAFALSIGYAYACDRL